MPRVQLKKNVRQCVVFLVVFVDTPIGEILTKWNIYLLLLNFVIGLHLFTSQHSISVILRALFFCMIWYKRYAWYILICKGLWPALDIFRCAWNVGYGPLAKLLFFVNVFVIIFSQRTIDKTSWHLYYIESSCSGRIVSRTRALLGCVLKKLFCKPTQNILFWIILTHL